MTSYNSAASVMSAAWMLPEPNAAIVQARKAAKGSVTAAPRLGTFARTALGRTASVCGIVVKERAGAGSKFRCPRPVAFPVWALSG